MIRPQATRRRLALPIVAALMVAFYSAAVGQQAPPAGPKRQAQRREMAVEVSMLALDGHETRAIERLRELIEIEKQVCGPDGFEVAESLAWLAELSWQAGDFNAARELGQDTIARYTRLFDEKNWRVAQQRYFLAAVDRYERASQEDRFTWIDSRRQMSRLRRTGELEQALEFAHSALAVGSKILGPDHPETAQILWALAQQRLELGESDGIDEQLRQVMRIASATVGAKSALYADALDYLARYYEFIDDLKQAETLYTQVIELRREVLGPTDDAYAVSLNNLGVFLNDQERYAEAEPLYRQAIAAHRAADIVDEVELQTSLANLSRVLVHLIAESLQADDLDQAMRRAVDCRDVRIERFGKEHWETVDAEAQLALIGRIARLPPAERRKLREARRQERQADELSEQGDTAAAADRIGAAVATFEQVLGADEPALAEALNHQGYLLYDDGQMDACAPVFERAARLATAGLGPKHPLVGTALGNLGRALYALNRADEARERLLESVANLEAANTDANDYYVNDLTTMRWALADIYAAAGDARSAEPLLRLVLDNKSLSRVDDPDGYAQALVDLGNALRMQGDYSHAESLLQESVQRTRANADASPFSLAVRLNFLGLLYDDQEQMERATPYYEEAVDLLRRASDRETDFYALVSDNLGQAYVRIGEYFRAEPLLFEALEIRRRLLGIESPEYRTTLQRIGLMYADRGDPRLAVPYFQEAASLTETHTGAETVEYLGRLQDLAMIAVELGRAAEAAQTRARALAIGAAIVESHGQEQGWSDAQQALIFIKKLIDLCLAADDGAHAIDAARLHAALLAGVYGAEDWRAVNARVRTQDIIKRQKLTADKQDQVVAAVALANQAEQLREQGRYLEALPRAQQALDTNARVLGDDDPATLNECERVAIILRELGRLDESLALLERAVEARTRLLGKVHPDVRESLTNLGITLRQMGQYARCEENYLRVLELTAQLDGEHHTSYANALNSLAVLYYDMANYGQALSRARRSVEIYAELLGEDHLDYANALATLGTVYVAMEDYDRAIVLLGQQTAIVQRHLGPRHPQTLECQYNLGLLYHEAQMYDRALPLYIEYRDAWEKLAGRDNPRYAAALNAIGNLHYARDEIEQAIESYRQALDIRSRLLGPRHPLAVQMMSNLGTCYYMTGRYPEAEQLVRESLTIREQILPPDHPHLVSTRTTLAELLYATGRTTDALAQINAALESDARQLDSVATFTGEDTLSSFLEASSRRYNRLLAMTAGLSDDPAAAELALRWTLARKAVALDARCDFRNAGRVFELQPAVAAAVQRVRAIRDTIAAEAVSPSAGDVQARRNDLTRQLAAAEDALRQALLKLGVQSGHKRPSVADVRQGLSREAALVEYVRAPMFNFASTNPQERRLPDRYFALVLRGDADPPVAMIDLGEAEPIEALIAKLRDETTGVASSLAVASEADVERQYKEIASTLYARVVAPLEAALGDARTIYAALDGRLHFVPFSALVDAQGRYMIESRQVAVLSSGRDLLRINDQVGSGTYVFAGPNYNLSAAGRAGVWNELREPAGEPRFALASRGAPSEDLRGLRWSPLAGAAAEADDVRAALADTPYSPVQVYAGDRAIEELFKRLDSPRILHVATHGFFLPQRVPDDESTGDRELERGRRGLARLRESANPLLRAGIVLAGANDFDENAQGVDDGWVTAEEISQLDLAGTELVVLSACETGLGDLGTKGSEGVYGLRRALLYAGAQSLVTSLFSVPDAETQDLMSRFYRHLAAGDTKLVSLHAAQLELLTARREEKEAAHPFFWASFIYVGRE